MAHDLRVAGTAVAFALCVQLGGRWPGKAARAGRRHRGQCKASASGGRERGRLPVQHDPECGIEIGYLQVAGHVSAADTELPRCPDDVAQRPRRAKRECRCIGVLCRDARSVPQLDGKRTRRECALDLVAQRRGPRGRHHPTIPALRHLLGVMSGRDAGPTVTTMPDAPDTLYVAAASYDSVNDAIDDYELVKALYYEIKASDDFDAAVIARNDHGKVEIVRKHEQPTRHGAAHGLGWGLAAGAVAALFPAVGILGALAVGGGAGASIGAVSGHVSGGMRRDDLKELGDVLDEGEAGLIVVYATNMADQIAANIKAANRWAYKATDMAADELAEEIKAAEAAHAGAAA